MRWEIHKNNILMAWQWCIYRFYNHHSGFSFPTHFDQEKMVRLQISLILGEGSIFMFQACYYWIIKHVKANVHNFLY